MRVIYFQRSTRTVAKYRCWTKHGVNYITVHKPVRAENNHGARVFLDNTRNVGPDNLQERRIFFSNIEERGIAKHLCFLWQQGSAVESGPPRPRRWFATIKRQCGEDVCEYIVVARCTWHCSPAAGNCSTSSPPLCFSSVDVGQKWINYGRRMLSSTIVSRWAVSACTAVPWQRDSPCVFIHPPRWFTSACFIRLSQPPSRVNLRRTKAIRIWAIPAVLNPLLHPTRLFLSHLDTILFARTHANERSKKEDSMEFFLEPIDFNFSLF